MHNLLFILALSFIGCSPKTVSYRTSGSSAIEGTGNQTPIVYPTPTVSWSPTPVVTYTPVPTNTPTSPGATWFEGLSADKRSSIIWFEDHEGSNIAKWDDDGKPWASGSYAYKLVQSPVHSGKNAIWSQINTKNGQSGVRWAVRKTAGTNTLPDSAFYSVWFFFEREFDAEWFILMQWKTAKPPTGSSIIKGICVDRLTDGKLYLTLHDKVDSKGNYAPEAGPKFFSSIPLPIGQWVHLEVFYKHDKGWNGELIAWQNGQEIFRQSNTRTQFDYPAVNLPRQWTVNAYADKLNPNPFSVVIDDAAISSKRLHE